MKTLIYNNRPQNFRATHLWTALFLLLFVKISVAQDLHYSQFYNSPLNVNPAKTGVFNGDQRIMASYRDQWRSIPVPWQTFTLSYDQKIYLKNNSSHFFSGGVFFNYDRQGAAQLTLNNINLAGSYTRLLNEQNLLTLGLSLGYASRGFDPESLTWDRQWDGDVFNAGAGSGENFTSERIGFIENSIGINYRWQKSKRTKVDIGLGAFHFVQPKVAFIDTDDVKLPRRFSLTGVGSFKLIDMLDLQLHGIGQLQQDYREYLFGGLVKIHVDLQRGKEFELHLGANYRTTKSLSPVIAIQYRNIYGSFGYDIDLSNLSDKTNNRGGPELHFTYIISKVKPLQKFKVCPIF